MDRLRNNSGQSVILITLVLSVVFYIVLYSTLDLAKRNTSVRIRDIDRLLLDEVTSSAFAVAEGALDRRMWEAPPDNACLKSETFTASINTTTGPTLTVTAKYNLETRNFELVSTGELKNLKSRFKKQVRVVDVSDYLIFAGGDQDVVLGQSKGSVPAALIAKDRKIYTKGQFIATASIERGNNPKTDWNGSPALFPQEYGMIVQGDRLQFRGGITYKNQSFHKAENPVPGYTTNNPEFLALSAPYMSPNGNYDVQAGAGNLIILKDAVLAENLRDTVATPTTPLVTKAQVSSNVYPIALFGGAPPLVANTANDNGSYFNNPDSYSIFYYLYGGGGHKPQNVNATCLKSAGSAKGCSNSNSFPVGFNKWREDAGLESTLFAADAAEVTVPKVGWDQLEALEEDAALCGSVVTAPVNPYVDCPVWDYGFMNSYSLTNSMSGCLNVSQLNMSSISLNNFSPSSYSTEEQRKRSLRRVIFLKNNPTVIEQNQAAGILTNITDPAIRASLALWVVSDQMLSLRGFQADTTSPLDSQPTRLRQVSFNTDDAEAVTPIPLTIFTNDKIHLLSPFYQPMTKENLANMYPVASGKIRPVRHNMTDYVRYEDDGFKFGYRRYRIKNVNLITSTNVDPSSPFYLQGLWSAMDGTGANFVTNQCMVTSLTESVAKAGTSLVVSKGLKPSPSSPLVSGPNHPLPPVNSKFYNGNQFPAYYSPQVFSVQGTDKSIIDHIGGRVHITFDFTGHPTKPDINTSTANRITERYTNNIAGLFDMSQRTFEWDYNRYFQIRPAGTVCNVSNIADLSNGSAVSASTLSPAINDGSFIFQIEAPATGFRNTGAFTGLDFPVIETNK